LNEQNNKVENTTEVVETSLKSPKVYKRAVIVQSKKQKLEVEDKVVRNT
jgi:hypothetical protein